MEADSKYISCEIARFRATGDPRYAWRALKWVVLQGRLPELLVGAYWLLRHRPPRAPVESGPEVARLLWWSRPRLLGDDWWTRDAILQRLGTGPNALAVDQLPADFAGARREAIACEAGIAVIGEYGEARKRLCWLTEHGCHVAEAYVDEPPVRHIHAVFPVGHGEFLVTTGDSVRYLDLWRFDGRSASLVSRRTRSLGGQTAIARVGGRMYLGSDWSSRPNYLETEDGRRFLVPRPASSMYAVAFLVPDGRHLVTLHKSLSVLGGKHAVSVFDTQTERFVYCAPFELADDEPPPLEPRKPLPLREADPSLGNSAQIIPNSR